MLVLACTAIAGCTRGVVTDDNLPTGPTPVLTVVKLTITPLGGGNILVGGTAPMTTSGGLPGSGVALGAFAEYNNGQGRYVEAVWTSSDDSILAVVDQTLVARKRGTATLTATFGGQSDTEDFVVDGGFVGRWSGSYVVEQCTGSTGSMQDVLCRAPSGSRSGIMPVGATFPFALEITETGGDDISGRVLFGTVTGVLAGKNRGGGYYYLMGDISGQGGTISIIQWNTRAANDLMEGVIAFQVKLDGVSGTGAVGVRLKEMRRQ
jgi:hypothetical protein